MLVPKLPVNELERMEAVIQYRLLDTLPEVDYDNITKLVSSICEVQISLITLLDNDRNFFKSHLGIPINESPRDISFCGHAILEEAPIFIVKDARLDARFKGNPLVDGMDAIFYAGVPLINPEGYALGTLCVFDHKPRELTSNQIEALIILGKQVVNLLELGRKNLKLETVRKDLIENNIRLKNFASHVSHDLKSPLANIISLTGLLREDNSDDLSPESLEYISYIEDSANILKDYIDGILFYYKADELLFAQKEDVNLSVLFEDIKQLLISRTDEFYYSDVGLIANINKSALTQILINLVDNALKYNDNHKRIIGIIYSEDSLYHRFTVTDNGIGIAEDKEDFIFELFTTIPKQELKPSTGIGLSTVKNLVSKLDGQISVKSKLGKGSAFTFTMKK